MKPPLTTAALSWADHHLSDNATSLALLPMTSNNVGRPCLLIFVSQPISGSSLKWADAFLGCLYVLIVCCFVAFYFCPIRFIFLIISDVLYTLFFFSRYNYLHFFFSFRKCKFFLGNSEYANVVYNTQYAYTVPFADTVVQVMGHRGPDTVCILPWCCPCLVLYQHFHPFPTQSPAAQQ
jgi:hypothetical protein